MSTADPVDIRARFLAAITGGYKLRDDPGRLSVACVEMLPVQRAGIAVQVGGTGLEVLSASDEVAELMEWTQVALGEGPGVDAVARRGPVLASDIAVDDGRWPIFIREAAAAGVGAMYAFPMQVGAVRVGVLDLYRELAAPLETSEFADAVAVTEVLTAMLLVTSASGGEVHPVGEWWAQALGTRKVHQATGMIVAQLGISAGEAYARLQAFAFAHGRLFSDVARDVVQRRLRFDVDPDPDEPVTTS